MERIVITSEGKSMESEVSQHFGRCPYFMVVEAEGGEVKSRKAVHNPHYEKHEPFEVPEFISRLKPDVLITGGMGPRALQVFRAKKVEVIRDFSGRNEDAVRLYLKGLKTE